MLGKGVHTLSSPIIIDRDDVVLRGQGQSTKLVVGDGAQCPAIIVGDTVTPPVKQPQRVTIRALSVDGNRDNQGSADADELWGVNPTIRNSGIVVRNANTVTVADVFVTGTRSAGVLTEKNTENFLGTNMTVTKS